MEFKIKKSYNPEALKQIAREIFELYDKQLNKELAKEMINPYSFTDRALQIEFIINLDSHHINHANSIIIIKPNFAEFGIEFRYNNKILEEIAIIYARLINQNIYKYHTFYCSEI